MSRRDQSGALTAFLAVFVLALFVLAGLVLDGGYALAAKRRAINEAQAAARAGAAALASADLRAGTYRFDEARAVEAARAYLAATGHDGEVTVEGDAVAVTVRFRQPVAILGIVGVRDVAVAGSGRARSVHGVVEEE